MSNSIAMASPPVFLGRFRPAVLLVWLSASCLPGTVLKLSAADDALAPSLTNSPASTNATAAAANNHVPSYNIIGYTIEGNTLLATNLLVSVFSKYGGTNVSLESIVQAATDLQAAYRDQGYPGLSIAVAPRQTNGIVTMNIFQAVIPQIVVAGRRYPVSSPGLEIAANLANHTVTNPPTEPVVAQKPVVASTTATNIMPPLFRQPVVPAAPIDAGAMALARAALLAKFAELAKPPDTRVHVVSTNAGPRFDVEHYHITGNTVLAPQTFREILTNIDGAFGTNVSFDGIRTVLSELQNAYRDRGYITVALGLPQQKLTNATVNIQVTEGRLAVINVTGNRYFSSNNVMRALPSLHTNLIIVEPVFRAELNQANANQDRQIYPEIGPGPDPGTTALSLRVKDQLPLHAKIEFNNESSPDTPDLRINSSAVYNNLWQLDHTLGVQYSFSPQQMKPPGQWGFFDEPAVANYSTFYRLPLGNPRPVEDIIANSPGNFGYDEATHKFNLPSPTGQADLTVFASRSTIDTGLATVSSKNLYNTNGDSLVHTVVQEDSTVNSDIGSRINIPLVALSAFNAGVAGGFDYKSYNLDSRGTNIFTLTSVEIDNNLPPPNNTVTNVQYSRLPVPYTVKDIEYLPLTLQFNGGSRDDWGTTAFGAGFGGNIWYSSQTSITSYPTNKVTTTTYLNGEKSLQFITGSKESTGYWMVINPSFTRTFVFHTNWVTTFHGDGQWASQPLISNEQFGIGGVNSVRGYHEGEDFGDTGWHFSLEQQSSPLVVGTVYGHNPLTVRGSVYMDIATVYLLDPLGRPGSSELWSTGFGFTASVGSHWQARFLFSVPLIGTSITPQDQPYFNFNLTAQF
jgi:hemolysin activation/secretion protein